MKNYFEEGISVARVTDTVAAIVEALGSTLGADAILDHGDSFEDALRL